MQEVVEQLIEDQESNEAEQNEIIVAALVAAKADAQDEELQRRAVDFSMLDFKRVLGAGAFG